MPLSLIRTRHSAPTAGHQQGPSGRSTPWVNHSQMSADSICRFQAHFSHAERRVRARLSPTLIRGWLYGSPSSGPRQTGGRAVYSCIAALWVNFLIWVPGTGVGSDRRSRGPPDPLRFRGSALCKISQAVVTAETSALDPDRLERRGTLATLGSPRSRGLCQSRLEADGKPVTQRNLSLRAPAQVAARSVLK
jgi:hypothetical protein